MTEKANPRSKTRKLSSGSKSPRTSPTKDAQDNITANRFTDLFKTLKLEPLKFDNSQIELSQGEPSMERDHQQHCRRKPKKKSKNEMQLTQSTSHYYKYYNQMPALVIQAMLHALCKAMKEDDDEREHLFKYLHDQLERLHMINPVKGDEFLVSMQAKYYSMFDNLIRNYQYNSDDSVNSSQVPTLYLVPKYTYPPKEFAQSLSVVTNFMPKKWTTMPFLEQSRFVADFTEMGFLGRGGYGKVYKAQNRVDGMIYAVKKIKLYCTNEEKLHTVQREVHVMASLKHPNIVTYFSSWWETGDSSSDSSEHSNGSNSSYSQSTSTNGTHLSVSSRKCKGLPVTLYVQMELCQKTLDMYLKERNDTLVYFKASDSLDVIDEELSSDIFVQILIGVEYIHSQSMMHRDLKPSNVFVDKEKRQVKIGDFGLARTEWIGPIEEFVEGPHTPLATQSNFTAKLGTESYAAPEQLSGSNYDKKADLYSLGFINFQLFYPFETAMEQAKAMQSLRRQEFNIQQLTRIKEKWPLQAEIILKLLSHDPRHRPSASEVRELCPKITDDNRIEQLKMQIRKKDEMLEKMTTRISTQEQQIKRLEDQKKRLYKRIGYLMKDVK